MIIKNKMNKTVFALMSTSIAYSNIPKYKIVISPRFLFDIVFNIYFFHLVSQKSAGKDQDTVVKKAFIILPMYS